MLAFRTVISKKESGAVASGDNFLDFDWVVASLSQIGSNKMFRILASTFYTHPRMSLLFLGQQAFKIDQSRMRPM